VIAGDRAKEDNARMKFNLRLKPIKPAAMAAASVGADEFAAAMESFAPFPARIALAVSGGPDSMALAFCLKRWCDQKNADITIAAFIVDHNLRAASAAEAVQTQKTLAHIGIEAEILRWRHSPHVTRLHETARKARFGLLVETCRRHGMAVLLFAHHRDDQAETILMRFAKGSGIDGLCGMRAQTVRDGIRILRPFLSIPKERLIATCRAANLAFAHDPSNASQKFARGRLRHIMPLLEAEGFSIDRLLDLAKRAQDAKTALGHATSMLVRVATKIDDTGIISIDLEHLRSSPRAIAERALGICLQSIHPEDYASSHAALTTLTDALLADADMATRTLHGCLIGKNGKRAFIMRECAAIEDAPAINPGETLVWDKRWHIALSTEAQDRFTIRPLGNPPHEILDRLAPGLRKQIPQGRGRTTLPSLWLNDALALIPALPCCAYSSPAKASLALFWPPADA
jgi:tRNA(Ile)-lysidine synthase